MAGKKILLVEDDNNLREIYGARLQAEGYDIISAPDGENALAIAVKEKPDLIISDIMMPKVSGFDMLDILRNAPETKDTKIIMMTALSQAEDKARADKLGADMYLVKSQVTLEDVTKAVHKILDEPSDAAQEADSAAAQEMVSGAQKKEDGPAEQTSEEPPVTPPPQPQPQPEPTTPPQPPKPGPPKPEEPPQDEAPLAPEPEPPASPTEETPSADAVKVEEPVKAPETEVKPEPAPPETENTPSPPVDSGQTSTNIPVIDNSAGDDDGQASPEPVGPTLAQALEDEEKALQDKSEEKPEAADSARQSPSPTVQPQPSADDSSQPKQDDEQPDSGNDDDSESQDNPLDDKPGKKVIKPINDLSKSPDINELVAKEEAKEAAGSSGEVSQASEVVKPQLSGGSSDQAAQNDQSSADIKDDFGKISL